MAENIPDRCLLIRSRLAEGYTMTESGHKDLQHVFTDWFPRTVYYDLTDDTVRVDVVVRKDFTRNHNVFRASFIRADDSVIKCTEYSEDRLHGKVCGYYNLAKTRYDGKKDGFDHRRVFYAASPITIMNRPK